MAREAVFIIGGDQATRDAFAFLFDTHGLATRDFASPAEFLATYVPGTPGCLLFVEGVAANGLAHLSALRDRGVALAAVVVAEVPTPALHDSAASLDAVLIDALDIAYLTPAVEQALTRSPSPRIKGPNRADRPLQDDNRGRNKRRCSASLTARLGYIGVFA